MGNMNDFDLNVKEINTNNNEVDGRATPTTILWTITATPGLTTITAGSGGNYSEDAVCSMHTC